MQLITNFWTIVLIALLLVLCLGLYSLEQWEFFWFLIYLALVFNTIFLFFIDSIEIIILYFLNQIIEPIIVLDPALFTAGFLFFILHCSFILSVCFMFSTGIFFFLYLCDKFNVIFFFNFCIVIVYYISIIFWIHKYDLFFSNWFAFSYLTKFSTIFDFQPDLDKFIYFFWTDYWELLVGIFLIHFLFYFSSVQGFFLYFFYIKPCRYLIFMFIIITNLYLFSEFTFINDFSLFIFSWFLCFIFEFLFFFIYYLKQYKIFNLSSIKKKNMFY